MPMRRTSLFLQLGLVGGALASMGCPGSLDDPSRFEDAGEGGSTTEGGGCPDVPGAIFAQTCAWPPACFTRSRASFMSFASRANETAT